MSSYRMWFYHFTSYFLDKIFYIWILKPFHTRAAVAQW